MIPFGLLPDTGISNGQNVTALHGGALADYRRTVGFVFQSYHLLPALTALDSYRPTTSGALAAQLTYNPPSTWYSGGAQVASMDNEDNQYRTISVHAPATAVFTSFPAGPRLAGIFDPAKINEFDPLSRVPLGAYEPVVAVPADPAANRALHGSDLLPNQNLGGYVSQPVDLVTTLSALPALENEGYYGTVLPVNDPISVVRVRVAGVTGPNPVSLERMREVAQQIETRTGLDVDIVAGSSPSPTAIDLPAGKFGQPPLTLSENWVKKGVALAILTAIASVRPPVLGVRRAASPAASPPWPRSTCCAPPAGRPSARSAWPSASRR